MGLIEGCGDKNDLKRAKKEAQKRREQLQSQQKPVEIGVPNVRTVVTEVKKTLSVHYSSVANPPSGENVE